MTYSIMLGGIVVLSLILILWMRERIYEIGILLSIGMTKAQVNRLIVLPQALRIVIPSFGNEFVTMIKETAVLSYVGVIEILRSAQLWNAATYNTFEAYIGVALVYLLMTIPLSKLVGALEKNWKKM